MDSQSFYLNKMIVSVVFYFLAQLLPVQSGIAIPKTSMIAIVTPQPSTVPPPSKAVMGKSESVIPSGVPTDAQAVTLKRVVDGDTLQVVIDGKTVKVRLIGINTPEVVDPRKPVQCFGKEASNHAKELLSDKNIFMKADPSQADTDKFSRLLRYIWLANGSNLNYEMIADGFAYEYTYDIPYLYQAEFKKAQLQAQNANLGLWSKTTCNGNL